MRNMPTAKKICIKSIVTSPSVSRKGALPLVRVRLLLPAAPGLPGQVYRYGFLTAKRIISISYREVHSFPLATNFLPPAKDGFQSPTERFIHFHRQTGSNQSRTGSVSISYGEVHSFPPGLHT